MSGTVMAVLGLGAALGLAWFYRWKCKRQYQSIERMLDEILSEEPVSHSDIQEGELSALAHKARRIQEKLNLEVQSAREEKEEVKSLISNMSHQLKTPLSNVLMYQEILERPNLEEERREVFWKKLRVQSEKIDWILRSLFKMVRLETGAIQFQAGRHPIKETVSRALSTVYEKAQSKEIEITVQEFEDVMLYHNPEWTAEVFINLLENGVKYTPFGGRITICLVPYELYSEIQIKDTGMGIPKKDLPYIFKRFYRSAEAEWMEGTGIGLYLSRMILEMEKGYITVDSEEGKGSSFHVFLQNCKD